MRSHVKINLALAGGAVLVALAAGISGGAGLTNAATPIPVLVVPSTPWYAPSPRQLVATIGLNAAPLGFQPEGTERDPTRRSCPISAEIAEAALPGRPTDPSVSACPSPVARSAAALPHRIDHGRRVE
jgi:hypothetical protein